MSPAPRPQPGSTTTNRRFLRPADLRLLVITLLLISAGGACGAAWHADPGRPYCATQAPTPSNPLRGPGMMETVDTLSVCNGTAPEGAAMIPNLQFGYVHTTGKKTGQGFLTIDYMVPFQIGADVVFLETHGAFETFNRTKTVDPFLQGLFGGGIRKRLPGDAMIGVTGFYNLIRVAGKWHGTPIVGGELAWLTAGSGVISLTVNQYGGISAVDYVDQFVKGRGDFKIEASYQQAFVRDVCDIRLRLNGYTVRRDEDIRGWNAGFDLIGVDRVLTLRFEGGHDKLSGAYYSGSCVVTLGLQLENLMCGVSPFVKP